MKKKIKYVILILLILCSLIPFAIYWNKNHEQIEIQNKVKEVVEAEPDSQGNVPSFAELKAINPRLVAIMYVPDTNIYFPIVQGEDNSYYLNHNFYNNYDEYGAIFMDASSNSDFSSLNTFIYGHNVLGGTGMFSFLENYMNESYYQQHPIIMLQTENELYEARIFSAYKDQDTSDSYQPMISDEVSLDTYIDTVKGKSYYDTLYGREDEENIVTFYTCSLEGITRVDQLAYGKERYYIHCYLHQTEENS